MDEQTVIAFLRSIKLDVVQLLGGESPVAMIGREEEAATRAEFQHLGDSVPLDWVAFGFEGRRFFDAHVGVIVEPLGNGLGTRIGLHLCTAVWDEVAPLIGLIDWHSTLGEMPRYSFSTGVREHQLCDPPIELAASEHVPVGRIVERAVRYHRIAAPCLAKANESES